VAVGSQCQRNKRGGPSLCNWRSQRTEQRN